MALNYNDAYYLDLDAPTEHLIDTVKVIAAYGCPDLDPKKLCSCQRALQPLTDKEKQLLVKIHFTLEWEQHLIATDAAFIFNQQDHAAFSHLTGTSPREFARQFALATFAAPAMIAPATTTEDTVESMLACWADHAANWRARYSNKEAARTAVQACQPGDDGAERYRNLGVPDPRYPPQIGKRLILQRARMRPQAATDHSSTIYLLPLKSRPAHDVKYMIVGVRPCHEDCSTWRLVLDQGRLAAIIRGLHAE
ncbi:hypothetical protein LTR36_002283 [Oleoguttula mirabilis]|uniref:Uncharacterized protein n=1 Tax=Oleoguttula mirabilis TaxID=1507867 RepID=A0AAV9JMC7_9PEZI|nr:hypothetical protein LTR36_002283 [Oleoguttula mirabilis]